MTSDQLHSHAPIITRLAALGWTCESKSFGALHRTEDVYEAVYAWELTPPGSKSDLDTLEFTEPFTLDDVWKAYGENLADDNHGDVVAETFHAASLAVLNQLSAIYAKRAAGDTSVVIPVEIVVPSMTIQLGEGAR